MTKARHVKTTGGSPSPARRIVEFRARENDVGRVRTACDEHHAVGQQGRGVIKARGVEAAGLLKLVGDTCARLHEHQSGREQNQREQEPPSENPKRRPKSGGWGIKFFLPRDRRSSARRNCL